MSLLIIESDISIYYYFLFFRAKFSILGFFYLLLKAGIFVTLILEYQNRQEWLNSRSIHKDIPDIWIFWSRIISILICGCFMPFLVFNNQTKRTCLSIWNTNKTPSVVPSTFPTVAYTQTVQNMVSVFLKMAKSQEAISMGLY
jgi:hypothetical protein